MRLFRLALVLVCLAVPAFSQTESVPATTPEKKPEAKPPDYSQEPFIVESMHTAYRYEADGTGTKIIQTRIHLQSESAVQKLGQLAFAYSKDFEKLDITGRVLKSDGTSVAIPDSAIQDMTSSVSRVAPMYTDVRQKHVIVPSLRPADTLEYELKYTEFAAMAPNQFWTAYDFNRTVIMKDEQLVIDVPASKFVNVKTRDEFKPEVTEKDGRKIYTWKTNHLEREPEITDKKELRKKRKEKKDEPAAVQVSTFKTWDEIGNWYNSLQQDRLTPSDAIRLKANDLVTDRKTDPEKLEALYTYVAENYRYVSLSFGLGRFQPHAASEIFTNEYGDCKDKHTLLASMAGVAGVKAYAALTSGSRKVDPDFPSPAQFDHVITYVPAKPEPIWLDTTSDLAPFGLILPQVRGKKALVVGLDGKSEIKEVPETPAIPSHTITDIDGTVSELGTLEADVRLSMRGDVEVIGRLGARAVPENKRKEYVTYLAKAAGVDGDVSNVVFSDINDTKHPLEYRFHLTKLNFFNRFDKTPHLPLPMGTVLVPQTDDSDDDKPFDVGLDSTEYHLKLQVPKQFEVQVPLPVKIDRDYGRYESRYSLDGNIFTSSRVLELKVVKLPADRRNEYAAFRRTVLSDSGQRAAVTVAKTAGGDDNVEVKPEELVASASSAFRNGEYQSSIDLLERAIKKDPKNKTAYNDLGRAYRAINKYEQAEGAYKKAIEIDPFNAYAYNNLGLVYWDQRHYDDAEKAFQKQIEIDPLDKYAHSNLGQMMVQEKKYAEAEGELEKAVTITPDNAQLHIRLGAAQLNLGKTDKAKASFDKAVSLSATPGTWNNIAYVLAEHKTDLDHAQQYAESAVTTVAAQLRNVQLADLKIQQLNSVYLLATFWDTLGWVHFQKGNTKLAEKYIAAAWDLSLSATTADHLAQIFESKGQRDKAKELYLLALANPKPDPDTRPRAEKLIGSDAKLDSLIAEHRDQLPKLRTFALKEKSLGTADFYISLAPSSKVEDARFINGDEKLKDFAATLKAVDYKAVFPDDTDTRIVRRGTLTCGEASKLEPIIKQASEKEKDKAEPKPGPCTFVLQTPDSIHSVN